MLQESITQQKATDYHTSVITKICALEFLFIYKQGVSFLEMIVNILKFKYDLLIIIIVINIIIDVLAYPKATILFRRIKTSSICLITGRERSLNDGFCFVVLNASHTTHPT